MPDNNGSPTEILVYSWKPLWIYWPVYLALVVTEKTLPVRFRFTHPAGQITDKIIRERLGKYLKAHPRRFAMALCEPGPIEGFDDHQFSRIPLIWRMPHWLVTTDTKAPIKTLYCYPAQTTSGDYARTLANAGLIGEKKPRTEDLLSQNLSFLRRMSGSAAALTFTPSHLWESSLRAVRQFPGPNRDITALVIPNSGIAHNSAPGMHGLRERVRDTIRGRFQEILQEFGTTHGDDGRVTEYVAACKLPPAFYGGHEYPSPKKDLGTALAEYIRQGCYFPSKVVGSALTGELRRIADEVLTGAKTDAFASSSSKLSALLSSGHDWSQLSFQERLAVWATGTDGHHRLHVRITHAPTEDELLRILTKQRVNPSASATPITVSSLNAADRRLFCPTALPLCLHKERTGKSQRAEADPCFTCTIAGQAMPVLRSAAGAIAPKLGPKQKVGFTVCQPSPLQSLLCWEDVKDLVDLFRSEIREDKSGVCHITLCQPHGGGIVSFSILWNGSTQPKSGDGQATDGIREWAQSRIDAGVSLLSAGFWWRPRYQPLYGTKGLKTCACHKHYKFGYVAFFDTHAKEKGHQR